MVHKNHKVISIFLSIATSFLFVFAFATSTTTISSTGVTATGSGSFATLDVTATSTLASTTISGYLGIGTTNPGAQLDLEGFTSNDSAPIPQIKVRGTIDSSLTAGTANVFGGSFVWDTVGANTAGITGIRIRLENGYTGTGLVRGLNVAVETPGSGVFSPFDQNAGNFGGLFNAQGSGSTGDNVGSYSVGDNSSGLNIGAFGRSSTNGGGASIAHIGLAGYAQSDLADGGGQIGGFFSLHNSSVAWRTQLTGISASILADNGDTAYPIFVGRVNNTNAFTITSTGGILNVPSVDSTTFWQIQNHSGSPIVTIDSTTKSTNFGGRVLLNNDQRIAWYDTDGTTVRPGIYLGSTGNLISRTGSGNGFSWYKSDLSVLGMVLDVTTSDAARLGVKGALAVGSTYYSTDASTLPVGGAIFQGNVGIGTTSPYAKLSVWAGGTGSNKMVEFTDSASTTMFSLLDNGRAYFGGSVGIGATNLQASTSLEVASTTGTVAIGSRVSYVNILNTIPNTRLAVFNADNLTGFNAQIDIIQARNGATYPPQLVLTKTRGDGYGNIGDGEVMGNIKFQGSDGSQYLEGARISAVRDSTNPWSYLSFYTHNGSAIAEALRITGSGNVGIGTTSPYAKLSVSGSAVIGGSITVSSVFATSTTATSTFAGYIDVLGAATATSTFTGNLHVQGTLRAAVSYVGDLIFANTFRFYEDPMPIDGVLQEGPQSLKLANQKGEDVFSIDDEGNLTIKGILKQATTTEQSVMSLGLSWILDQFKIIGVTIADGIVSAKEFIAEKITSKQICVEDVCVDRTQFKELLDKNGIGQQAPAPVSESTPEPTSESVVADATTTPEVTTEPIAEASTTTELVVTPEPAPEPVIEAPPVEAPVI